MPAPRGWNYRIAPFQGATDLGGTEVRGRRLGLVDGMRLRCVDEPVRSVDPHRTDFDF